MVSPTTRRPLYIWVKTMSTLTLIWLGFLVVRFEVGWVNLPPCLKPVRIMLETSNLARKYTPICSYRKYTFYCLDPLSFAYASIFLQKISVFLSKKVPLLKAIV